MNTEKLITLFDTYTASTGLQESTVATYATAAGGFVKRLRDGCDITTRRANRVVQYFSDHWPLDLLWPIDIPRPDPAPDSPAVQAMIERQKQITAPGVICTSALHGGRLNQTENESDNPLTALNAKGHIADPEAFCKAISFGCAVQRSSFDQVVHQYADGRPRAGRVPRKGSIAADILKRLIAAGDVRFTDRIKREAEGRKLAKKLGLEVA